MTNTTIAKAVEGFLAKQGLAALDLKAVLIDMDGVLFDSMPIHAYTWNKTIAEEGLHMSEEEAYLHEGRTGRSTIEIVFRKHLHRDPTEEEVKRIYGKKAGLFDSMPEAPVMEGAPALLNTIASQGLIRVLVTGSGQKLLLNRVNHHFPGHFSSDLMVTAFDVTRGKPHPEPFLKGMQKAGAQAHQALVIENAPLGVESAKAAGLFTIAVNTGPLNDTHLNKADLIFHNLDELILAWPELMRSCREISLPGHNCRKP
ncbi:MAG TPA: HAD-IA family hydrolase [Bacteroidales bacterium]|nr:HAD-IA family hydrolase [Bacteroidales bacterium]